MNFSEGKIREFESWKKGFHDYIAPVKESLRQRWPNYQKNVFYCKMDRMDAMIDSLSITAESAIVKLEDEEVITDPIRFGSFLEHYWRKIESEEEKGYDWYKLEELPEWHKGLIKIFNLFE